MLPIATGFAGANPRWSSARPVQLTACGTALLAVLLFGGCDSSEPAQEAAEPPAVGVIEVREDKVNPFFEFVGKTRAQASVSLRARVTGFLEERNFDEGGDVEQGQVLFRIEPDQYQATLAQMEASLSAAEASLNRAQVDLARYQELRKSNNVSQQEVDKTQAEVLVQEAAVETARADIEKARLNVDYTEIIAPIAGRIDIAAFDVGNLIGPDAGVLATINRMDPIQVTFSLAETWYLEIQKAAQAHREEVGNPDAAIYVPFLRLSDGTRYEHPGSIDFLDNKVDEKTGTVTVRAEFANPDRILLPGQFVTVVIEREEAVDAVMIPQAAMLTDQGGGYVLAVNDDNVVETRRIRTGQRFGPNLVVTEGLEPGTRVVLYGIQKVRPGLTVKPELTAAPSDPMDESADDPVELGEGAMPGTDDADAPGPADATEADADRAAATVGDAADAAGDTGQQPADAGEDGAEQAAGTGAGPEQEPADDGQARETTAD
jgi:membrane fusion protein (multidrug efflux system)